MEKDDASPSPVTFLVDAQLPRRLAYLLRDAGYDTLHTLDLPRGNRTPDANLIVRADAEDQIVMTKDADFVTAHLLRGKPRRLLLISVGNCRNAALCGLVADHLDAIAESLQESVFVELSRSALIVHR